MGYGPALEAIRARVHSRDTTAAAGGAILRSGIARSAIARPAALDARESQFMMTSRMRKKLCPTMGLVKKSAKLSTVRT